jgi:gluconate 2-dehydrogenase gamma chain
MMPELTAPQRLTLAAAAERILPSEDGPGAAETGVADYVASALGEERLKGWLPLFAHGLERIDEISRETFGTGFAEAGPEQRDEILRRLQALPERPLQHFFAQLVRLCVEGFAGQEGPGWRFLGYPPEEMEGDGCLVPLQG